MSHGGHPRGIHADKPHTGQAFSLWSRLLAFQAGPVLALSPLAALSDPAAKENCMMHLLRSLPDPNLITFLFLLEHLKR